VDVTALENEVFSTSSTSSPLLHEGDFISLRRYKEGVYAIPYEGEEVKLHWANADQYYVKSSEDFRDYVFMIAGGKRVRSSSRRCASVRAGQQQGRLRARNVASSSAENPLSEENGELFIRFEYRPHDGKKKQDDSESSKPSTSSEATPRHSSEWTQELGSLLRRQAAGTAQCWRSISRSTPPATRSTTSSTRTWAASCAENSTSTSRTK
jgi:adenine-specific DNA-methyltransferase